MDEALNIRRGVRGHWLQQPLEHTASGVQFSTKAVCHSAICYSLCVAGRASVNGVLFEEVLEYTVISGCFFASGLL